MLSKYQCGYFASSLVDIGGGLYYMSSEFFVSSSMLCNVQSLTILFINK